MANENLNVAVTDAVTNVVAGKKFWESRTFWVNIIAAAAFALQSRYGFLVGPELQAMALAGVNLVLRKITDQPIVW